MNDRSVNKEGPGVSGLPVGKRFEPFPKGIRNTDIGNSERFVHLHGDRIRFVPMWKQWVVWDGSEWVRDPGAVRVTELAKDVSRQLFKEITNHPAREWDTRQAWARQSANLGRLRSMVKLARGIESIISSGWSPDE